MIPANPYYILTFSNTTSVMKAEACLKDHFPISIMPVPQEIRKGCGLAIRFRNPDETAIIHFLNASSLKCTLYKMETKKVDGKYPLEQLWERI